MKILYLSLDQPLDLQTVATGNQVRVQGLREVLEKAGHEVVQFTYMPDPEVAPNPFLYHSREELEDRIRKGEFDLIIAGYWSLLAHFSKTDIPVVLDFIAPRLLEQIFQRPESITKNAIELLSLIPKADHFIVGNQRQADLFLGLLLQAGFDCRFDAPVSIVPISVRGALESGKHPDFPLQIVNAGVDWPWRDSKAYRRAFEDLARSNEEIVFCELSGSYPDHKSTLENGNLLAYQGMQKQLLQCHIGMELGERNTEREFSHSFRAMEYLECGLPVLINSWIPLAALIREYDAGWVVDDPEELAPIMEQLLANPELLENKRQGVKKLTASVLNYAHSATPLLQYLESPVKAQRFNLQGDDESGKVAQLKEIEKKALPQKVSLFKILLRNIFMFLFCPKRPDSRPDVLMVSRSDLFPVDHGAAVKIIRTAEALSRQGRDVWLCTDSRKDYYQFCKGEMITHRFPLLIRLFSLPRTVSYLRLLKAGFPKSNSFLYLPVTDSSYITRVIYLSSRKPIGAYQAEFPAYVRPCRFARSMFGGKILLVQHNVEYDRIKNQVENLSEKNITTLKNTEVAMCHLADNIVAVSENDRQKMIRDGVDADKIHTIPHGVDLRSFRETPAINIHAFYGFPITDKVLVYHGTYSYPPNLEAMKVMATEILPRLEQRNIAVSVLAIGSKPPDFPLHARIHFAGSVDDLAEVISAADIAVVTLQEGGGTRMKILDYFAAGVPVISTAKGIEGIPVNNGVEALIIDDFDDICDAIENLLNNPDEGAKLSAAASHFVESLGWDAVVRQYLPLLH